jgi:protein SCO1
MSAPSPQRTLPIALFVIAALAAASGLWLGSRLVFSPQRAAMQSAVLYPAPRAVPDFHLMQANGKALARADWHGHWTLVYFGYASCPDVCPTTLATLKQAWVDLGKRGLTDQVRIDFVSVDPERDTAERLGPYVAFFSPDFVAASGSDVELTRLTRALGLVYSRTTDANGAIQVDHSGSVIIVDPQARLVGMFRPPFTAAAIAADVATLATRPD